MQLVSPTTSPVDKLLLELENLRGSMEDGARKAAEDGDTTWSRCSQLHSDQLDSILDDYRKRQKQHEAFNALFLEDED